MRSIPRTSGVGALMALAGSIGLASALVLCAQVLNVRADPVEEPPHSAALDSAIVAAAKRHGVPEHLVRRIIMRESKYNPRARNRSFWGLMQISYPTARSMGFNGTPHELLNPVVNLRYAVPYLANAFVIAGKREDAAVRLYAAGYYATAKSRGLISVLRTANSEPLSGVVEDQPILAANAVVQPPQSIGIFGALFGPGSQSQPQPAVQTATAEPAASQPAPASQMAAAAPAGTFDGPTATMVVDKAGEPAPPKKWTRDGGVTLIARGEQSLDQISHKKSADGASDKPRHRSRKSTAFAALDLPPSTAQAYTGAPGQDPRFAAAASQAAIMQATAGSTAPTVQPAAQAQADGPQPAVSAQQASAATPSDEADEPRPKKAHRTRQARRPKPKSDATKEARAEKASAEATPAPPAAR